MRPVGGYETSRRTRDQQEEDQKEDTSRRRLDQHEDHMNNKNGIIIYMNYISDTKYTWLLLTTYTQTTNKII